MSQQLKQKSSEQPTSQSQPRQHFRSSLQGGQQLEMSSIVKQVSNEQANTQQLPKRISKVGPAVLKNPLYYYKGSQKYDWKLAEINPALLLDGLTVEQVQFAEELPFENDIQLKVIEIQVVPTSFSKNTYYIVERKDKNGEGKFNRRYTEYIAFRKKLVQLWPAIFIPTLPNKTFIGTSDEDIIKNRTKYLNHFWRKLISNEEIYYSQEVQIFVSSTENTNIQATFEKIQSPKLEELLQKYKNTFSQAYETSIKEQFMYRKEQAPIILDEFQNYFNNKRKDLGEFKNGIRRLCETKKNYYRAVGKLNMVLLPDYEDKLLRWINGLPLVQDQKKGEQVRKSLEIEKTANKGQQNKEEEKVEEKVGQNSSQKVQKIQVYQGLYNSQAYKSQLQDLERQLRSFNSSNWLLYDLIKFQQKDLDTVLLALDQVKFYRKEMQYLTRNISINKDQIQSLNNKKTTLKIFFMGGSEDDKKSKLTVQNQKFSERLQKLKEFYLILLALVEKQLITYHKERVDYYQRAVKKLVVDETGISKAILKAHIYQVQIFAKIYNSKLKDVSQKVIKEGQSQQQQIQQ